LQDASSFSLLDQRKRSKRKGATSNVHFPQEVSSTLKLV